MYMEDYLAYFQWNFAMLYVVISILYRLIFLLANPWLGEGEGGGGLIKEEERQDQVECKHPFFYSFLFTNCSATEMLYALYTSSYPSHL